MNLRVSIALLFVSAAPTLAQARPMSDSVFALNRVRKWEEAGHLAEASMIVGPQALLRLALVE